MGLTIIVIVVVIAAILFFIYLKKTGKAEFNRFMSAINTCSRKEAKDVCEILMCYAVWADDSPNEKVPREVCNKFGCSSFTYSEATQLYNAAVKRHNYLLEQEEKRKNK